MLRWSLRAKILTIVSALLLAAVFAYLLLAEKVFREDKELLVFDTNRSNAERLSTELEDSISRVVDKMELLARLAGGAAGGNLARTFFSEDPEIVALRILSDGKVLHELVDAKKLEAVGLEGGAGGGPVSAELFPAPVAPGTSAPESPGIRVENRSLRGAVLYLLRLPLRLAGARGAKGRDVVVQALIDGRRWLDSFQGQQSLSVAFAVSDDGVVLAHPRAHWVATRRSLADFPLVRIARAQRFVLQQSEFEADGKSYLGVYRRAAQGGITVFSMTDKGTALAASRLLLEKTIVLSLIVITSVFLVTLFFASSLSRPLLRLVGAAREIGKGNFDTPIPEQTGDEIGALATEFGKMARDLKHSRALLEEYSHSLELKVQSRTRELEAKNVAIRSQQEMLVKTTRLAAVGETAGQAAHEVLNPLTATISKLETLASRIDQHASRAGAPLPVLKTIADGWATAYSKGGRDGYVEALAQPSRILKGRTMLEEDLGNLMAIVAAFEQLFSQVQGDLGILLRESQRIGRIVDGMRGLSRVTKVRRRFDLARLIDECRLATEDLLARYRVRIETRFARATLWIEGDEDEMRQVFANLIRNALDAIEARRKTESPTPESPDSGHPGLVRIAVEEHDGTIRVSIRDNGTGIRAEDRARVFEPDFSTKGADGTGFGLSICRRFAREAGGELVVAASEPGSFTEFELTLPEAPNVPS
jgi:signal transduction histidine kinase